MSGRLSSGGVARQSALAAFGLFVLASAAPLAGAAQSARVERPCVSGRYPHLAMFNHQRECGVGALAVWAGRLWAITYSPHQPGGSDDKLYEIDQRLNRTIRPESVGGTPASRMIHRESRQLIIGPYFIDPNRTVRVIPPERMYGRLTAVTRHLTDPAGKVYFYTMEEGFYEVDVRSLDVTTIHVDRNRQGAPDVIPGYHGKGAYTGQGRVVVSNNGERGRAADGGVGCLAEWDGRRWSVIRRDPFTEVTGPGGLEGARSDQEPIWAAGWDRRSVLLLVRAQGRWSTHRLPIGSYDYTARHGWYTEWPRIRDVGRDKLLMNMHGVWFELPRRFAPGRAGGLRPVADYLKITGDFCRWGDRIVFGCDDASQMGNPLAGQAQSNLWFARWDDLRRCGRPAGFGGVWLDDPVAAGQPSDPYLFAGFQQRVVHLAHDADRPVTFTLELDDRGDGHWRPYRTVTVPPRGYAHHVFPEQLQAEWVRVRANQSCPGATAYFHYGPGGGLVDEPALGAALADAGEPPRARSCGVIRPRGGDLGTLQLLASAVTPEGRVPPPRYYEMDQDLALRRRPDKSREQAYLAKHAAIASQDVQMDEASIIVRGRDGVRYRLPRSPASEPQQAAEGPAARAIREVVTERSLLNAGGTLYVLPRDDATGLRGLKPICTHDKQITDFCSWRGLLVLAGVRSGAPAGDHVVVADDGRAALWLGDVDDLWRLGKPRGRGGPWRNTPVRAGAPSDPYLMTGFDQKTLELRHDADEPVEFVIEVDFDLSGRWRPLHVVRADPGETTRYAFPRGYQAHWVRLRASRSCRATATFIYQ